MINKCRVGRTQTHTLVEIVGYEVVEARIHESKDFGSINEYMLDNRPVERKVEYLGKHPKSRNGVFDLIKELADCDAIEKGVILGIKANSDNLRGRLSFFEMQKGDLTYVTDSNGRRFVMLFTSKKKFELCPDIQGYVCFIKELFEALAVKEAVDGIAFNINSDEILLDKFVIRIVLEFINRAGE